jgi:two-component system cell cycle response regulator DivK
MGGMCFMSPEKTILHVEDNPENRLLVKRLLLSEGYNVVEAENGTECLKILLNLHPDLILMDINMPDMDGYALTNQLKSNSAFLDVPIVAITANVMKGDRERTVQAGCDGYIEKPIDVDRFLEQVAIFLNI